MTGQSDNNDISHVVVVVGIRELCPSISKQQQQQQQVNCTMRDLLSRPQSHCVVRIRELCPSISKQQQQVNCTMRDLLSRPQSHCVVRIRELCPSISKQQQQQQVNCTQDMMCIQRNYRSCTITIYILVRTR